MVKSYEASTTTPVVDKGAVAASVRISEQSDQPRLSHFLGSSGMSVGRGVGTEVRPRP